MYPDPIGAFGAVRAGRLCVANALPCMRHRIRVDAARAVLSLWVAHIPRGPAVRLTIAEEDFP